MLNGVEDALNLVKSSIVLDTFPKIMGLAFAGVEYTLDKTDWYARFENGSEIWFGGLDDKERTENILGQEYATIYLNEASQIPYSSRNLAITRLAQNVYGKIGENEKPLRLKAYYDCNPPSQAHWSYKLFIMKVDPESNKLLNNPSAYASLMMNPTDNADNLPAGYMEALEHLPARMRVRFLEGKFADITENALWNYEGIEKWRAIGDLPELVQVELSTFPRTVVKKTVNPFSFPEHRISVHDYSG